MTKKEEKKAKFKRLCDEVEEVVAAHYLSDQRYLSDDEVIAMFPNEKEKRIKKAMAAIY